MAVAGNIRSGQRCPLCQRKGEYQARRLMPGQEATLARKRSPARHMALFNGKNLKELRTAEADPARNPKRIDRLRNGP